jgi:cytosine/adenosine deaminase-related metal-dependent hydrolase
MFISSTGDLINKLKSLGINLNHWSKTKKNSLQSILNYLPKENNILLVHNTYSSANDLLMAKAYFNNLFWCLCPLSNRYIEKKLPAIDLFAKYGDRVTLGTDSLASNYSLSVLEEMKLIQKEFIQISFSGLLQWATINGAKALKIDQQYGSIEKGKTPGVNLISHFDFKNMKLTSKSEVKPLI